MIGYALCCKSNEYILSKHYVYMVIYNKNCESHKYY